MTDPTPSSGASVSRSPNPTRKPLRPCGACPVGSVLALAAAIAFPAAASAQAIVPGPPLLGLIERPAAYQPLPRRAPTLSEQFAQTCDPADPELEWARLPRALRDVPLEAMVGQLLVVSFGGKVPGDAGVIAAREAIAASRIGGVLFFRHNVGTADELRAVNAAFAEARPFKADGAGLPPIIAVDQEGGAVMRVRATEGAPATPSARDLAATTPEAARAAYAEMAEALASLGFTANLAPVVDMEVNPDNPVVARHGRSFGADPETVVAYATAFVDGHRGAGVATALKHFPGHGSSAADSHAGAIDLTPTFRRAELIPFRDLVAIGRSDMVMVGHLTLDGLTGADGLPASISPAAIDGFLRGTLCHEGIVVSDDLAMDAVSRRWSAPEAVRLMVEAGGDVALLSVAGDTQAAVEAIVAELAAEARASAAFAEKLRRAYTRIAHHKLNVAERRPGEFRLAHER